MELADGDGDVDVENCMAAFDGDGFRIAKAESITGVDKEGGGEPRLSHLDLVAAQGDGLEPLLAEEDGCLEDVNAIRQGRDAVVAVVIGEGLQKSAVTGELEFAFVVGAAEESDVDLGSGCAVVVGDGAGDGGAAG